METGAIIYGERWVKLCEGGWSVKIKNTKTASLWGFKINDKIRTDRGNIRGEGKGKKATVLGFAPHEDYLGGNPECLFYQIEEENFAKFITNPRGLTLLERELLPFKVGDDIVDEDGFRLGIIRLIDPLSEKILVESIINGTGYKIHWEWYEPQNLKPCDY